MVRMAGVAMVAVAAVYYAFYGLITLKQRLNAVRCLTRGLFCIRSAVACTQRPVEEVFKSLEGDDTAGVFKGFREGMAKKRPADALWSECLERTPLIKEERAIFMPFGACLASADRSSQLKTIDMMTNAAQLCEKRLLEQIDTYRATEMKIRIMCGIMAAILLI